MAQHLSDLRQWHALGQEHGRGGMPQAVRADLAQPRVLAAPGDDVADRRPSQRPIGLDHGEEHMPVADHAWAGVLEVVGQRLADIRRER